MEYFSDLNQIYDQNYKTSDEIEWKVEEVRMYSSFGIIAGKWWGKKDVQPILMLHGWLDNAGSFDRLIPLLPKHLSYLAIDLPGHGFSSKFQDGLEYHLLDYLHIIDFIVRSYKLEKVAILGHSVGSVLGYFYASLYPEKVKLVIGIDVLKPVIVSEEIEIEILISRLKDSLKYDALNQSKTEPPSYTIDEMMESFLFGAYGAISKNLAPYLLRRNIKKSSKNPGKFFFSWDVRLKSCHKIEYGHHVSLHLAKSISCPYLFIKATDQHYLGSRDQHYEVVKVLSENRDFCHHIVEGTHHVHLTNPEVLAPIINDFFDKYISRLSS